MQIQCWVPLSLLNLSQVLCVASCNSVFSDVTCGSIISHGTWTLLFLFRRKVRRAHILFSPMKTSVQIAVPLVVNFCNATGIFLPHTSKSDQAFLACALQGFKQSSCTAVPCVHIFFLRSLLHDIRLSSISWLNDWIYTDLWLSSGQS
jgi:hypothetical protein